MTTKYENEINTYPATVHRIECSPGNGMRYKAIAMRVTFPPHEGQWFVAFPAYGVCYYFDEGGYVAHSYVSEKMGHDRTGRRIPDSDITEFIKIIALVIGGSHDEE